MDKTGPIVNEKQIFRLATTIRNQILALKNRSPKTDIYYKNIDSIDYNLERLRQENRLRDKAINAGFLLAARRIEYGKYATMEKWANKITDNSQRIATTIKETYDSETYVPSIKDLIEEIRITKNTFKTLSYRDGVLSAKTHDITLSGEDCEIGLGDFKIAFKLYMRFDSSLNDILSIYALNPNPAQGRHGVTHPHVDDERLCAGDGDILIRQALQQGRIEDVFKLVLTVLNNYNDRSPYVHLNEWNGEVYSCDECGADDLTEDAIYSCECCNSIFCENCITSCDKCPRSMCMECSSRCEACDSIMCDRCAKGTMCKGCDQTICEDCMETCADCGENRCSECLKGCAVCDAKICSECSVECKECSTPTCGDCKMTCENCNRVLCAECSDKDKCNMFREVKA